MIVAIIPARGGSKRIKNKNIKKFYSKPILYWTLKALKKSKLFSKIVLTTDNYQIKILAKKLGIDCIISRPDYLADDYTGTKPVIEHAIVNLREKFKIKYVCCVYPCNPLLETSDLKESFRILKNNDDNFVLPVAQFQRPIQRAFKLGIENKIIFFNKKNQLKRTQDLVKYYYDAGQFYWGSVNSWLSKKEILSNAIGLILPESRSVDIDNVDDWNLAKLKFKIKIKKNKIL